MNRVLALLTTLVLSTSSFANDLVFEKVTRDIAVEKDGRFEQTNTMLLKLVTEAGAKGVGQIPIPYSDSLQELEVIEAYTIKPDGMRVDVKKEAIFTQAAPIAVSAPMFNDIKYRIIVFPEPMAGGKVAFVVRIKQKTPFFPGHISALEALPTTLVQEDTEIKLSAPADYALKMDVRGYEGGLVETKAGRTHWKWTLKNAVARKPEPFEIAEIDFGPYVAISSFADWADLAKAYLARVEDKIKPTEALRQQAADIVKGAKDKRDEARMIHEWVARNVRYVGVFLGLGGFVPRDVSQIIETKYGDCKDHTTLMMALLNVRGIKATTALIQTMNMFHLPKVPVVGAFNHAITYLPEFDLYLDGTSEFTRWDVLPQVNTAKPVLLTGLGKLGVTPAVKSTEESLTSVVKLSISENGSITGTSTVTTLGNQEAYLRAALANIPAGQEEKWVANLIRGAGPQATAKLINSRPRDFTTPQQFELTFDVKEAVSIDSPGAFRIPRGLVKDPIFGLNFGGAQVGKRTTPFVCLADTRKEIFEMTLPEKVEVAALPKPVLFEGKTIKFETSYKQVGNKIFVSRTLSRDRKGGSCAPEMWEETQQLEAAVARDGRGQVLLK